MERFNRSTVITYFKILAVVQFGVMARKLQVYGAEVAIQIIPKTAVG